MKNKANIKNSIKESILNDWSLSDWAARVEQIPAVKEAGLIDIEALNGGTINKTFKVKTKKDTWAVRFNHDDMPGIHRPSEAKVLELIQGFDFAPQVICNDFEQGYLITAYFEGSVWTEKELAKPENINRLVEKLKPMHQIPFQSKRTELVFRMVEYIHHFTKMDTALKSAINKTVNELGNLGFWQQQQSLLHFDLNPLNIISQGNDIRIIDWEYAGAGHPIIEWCVLQNYIGHDISALMPDYRGVPYRAKVQQLIDLMMEMWQT